MTIFELVKKYDSMTPNILIIQLREAIRIKNSKKTLELLDELERFTQDFMVATYDNSSNQKQNDGSFGHLN